MRAALRRSLSRLVRHATAVVAAATSVETIVSMTSGAFIVQAPARYRSLKSTDTSTATSTGVPRKRPGLKRH